MQSICCTCGTVGTVLNSISFFFLVPEVLHQTLNNYITYCTLKKQILGVIVAWTVLKGHKNWFWCDSLKENSGEIQQKVFEQWFDLPLKTEKGEKGRRESEARNSREKETLVVQVIGGQEFKQWKASEKLCSYRCSARGSCTSLIQPGCVDWHNVRDSPQGQQALQ